MEDLDCPESLRAKKGARIMSRRTRLKRLERWANRTAPPDNEDRRAMERKFDGLPLEVLLFLQQSFEKHEAKMGKAQGAPVVLADIDLPEDFRRQLYSYLAGESGNPPAIPVDHSLPTSFSKEET
jgi:hypothetical protein